MARKPKFQTPLENQLYDSIKAEYAADAKLTEYAVAKKAGITQSVLRRFYVEGKTLTLTTAGKLARIFDLRLSKNNSENQ